MRVRAQKRKRPGGLMPKYWLASLMISFFSLYFSVFQIFFSFTIKKKGKSRAWLLCGPVHFIFKHWQKPFLTCEQVSQVSEGEHRFTLVGSKQVIPPATVHQSFVFSSISFLEQISSFNSFWFQKCPFQYVRQNGIC